MANLSDRLFVTYVDAYNDLLKIWGQPNRTCATYIEKQLLQLVPEFNRSPLPSPNQIRKGMFCFAKYDDGNYYRGRIISDVLNNAVMVLFIDYGNRDRVDLTNIRLQNGSMESIVATIVAQADEFYLANIRSNGGWTRDVMNEIRRGLCCAEYSYRMVCHSGSERLVQINYRNEDYSSFLIRQELARPVSVKDQIIMLKGMLKNQQSIDQVRNSYRNFSFSQVPQQSNRDNLIINSRVQLGQVSQGHLNPAALGNPQSAFALAENNKSMVVNNNGRHFNVTNQSQNIVFGQNNNSALYTEAKSGPIINSIAIKALADELKNHLMKDSFPGPPESAAPGFVTQVLDVGSTHNVHISHIDDGPWSFSVQLVSSENELNKLMDDLADYNYQPIKLPLVLGYPCIAKSKEYNNYCRGIVVNIAHSAVKIYFVDFGNTEDLPLALLYEMPVKFFKVKAMSQKFALSGLQSVKPTEEIKKAFMEVVENEWLILHVSTLEGENLPTCDLYLKSVNIKRILNDKLRHVKKWDAIEFPRPGDTEKVVATWIDSPQEFYVQLKRCDDDLKQLKMELVKLGVNGEHFQPEEILPGTMCICFFTGDNNWYRAVITSVNTMKSVTVFYVDYGNTDVVDSTMIKRIGNGLIAEMRTQAIECCLHGYEKEPHDPSITETLEELILEKEVTMKVISHEKDRINVQLFDSGTDISLRLNKPKMSSTSVPSRSAATENKTEKRRTEGDIVNTRKDVKFITTFSAQNGSDDSSRSRGKRNFWNDKPKTELNWRSDDNRREFSPKKKEDQHFRSRDVKEPGSETKNEKYDGSKIGRYCFKSRKGETVRSNDKDQKGFERNWRGTEDSGGKFSGGDSKNKTKTGESLSERLRRAARENEARGLKLPDVVTSKDPVVSRYPVKLENMAVRGCVFKKKEVEIGSVEDVIVTYFINPNEIYVQLVSTKDKFREFMDDIQNYYATKLPLANVPKKGDVVVSKYKLDGVLYRALVVETEPITVRYIDFGNEEVSEKENLWPMCKRFLDLESQCLKCSLPNLKPVGSDTWPAPNAEIDKIFEHEKYKCTFLKQLDNCYEVNLIISNSGKQVRDELILSGFALSVENTTGGVPVVRKGATMAFDLMHNEVFSVFITHIVDPSEFYVQIRCGMVKAIEEDIRKYIAAEEFASPLDSLSVNNEELYLVKAKDGNWHRAKLIEKRELDSTVKLIDYGDVLSVNYEQIRAMPDDLVGYPAQAVQCSLFNDTDELKVELNDELAACNKKGLAVLIHDVLNERLKVTLYDYAGEKLEFLNCTNDVPARIRPITDLPIINREMLVIPSHITSPKEIYIQLVADVAELKELSSTMLNFYSAEDDCLSVEENIVESQIYAAKSVIDNCWYRAQILSLNDTSAKMFYIDFGNTEELPKENLRKLDSSFYCRHAYAKEVSLNIDYDDDDETSLNEKLRQLIEKRECTGYFVRMGDVLFAELVVEGASLTSRLVLDSDSVHELVDGMFKDFTLQKPARDVEGTKVSICHISHPGEFWVHEESITSELNILQDKLQTVCSDGRSKDDIEVGDVVGALFKNIWYRASVMAVNSNIISVQFLDYGNTSEIDKAGNKFILLDGELKKPAPFARKCSLKGLWKENATSRFKDIVTLEDTLVLLKISEGSQEVDLLQNGSSITEQLINEGYGMKKINDIVYITHINSPDDFYVQNESDQYLFDNVISELSEASFFEDATDINVNELYCAQHEDDSWYRAKVLAKDDNETAVIFIDYGDCSIVTHIKILPPNLKSLRPLSFKCCLANEKVSDTWSRAACNFFEEYINNEPLRMEVVRQEPEVRVVRLFTKKEEDLGGILAKLCEEIGTDLPETTDCEIIYAESRDSLHCQDDINYEECGTCEISKINTFISTENANTTSESSQLSDKNSNLSQGYSEKIVPGWVGLEGSSSEDSQKLDYSEKIVPGSISRGLSLEEISSPDITTEKGRRTSFSAPGTPLAPRRQQTYQKINVDDREVPGCVSRPSCLSYLVATHDKIALDEKQAAANVNGTMKDAQS